MRPRALTAAALAAAVALTSAAETYRGIEGSAGAPLYTPRPRRLPLLAVP